MAEGYAKMRVQPERNIALALTKALREIHGTNMQTIIIYQIESGGNNEEIIGDALCELLKR